MALDRYAQLTDIVPVGDLDASGDALKHCVKLVPAGRRFRLDHAYLSAEAAVSDADTDYNTFFLRDQDGNELARLENGPEATGTDLTQAPVEFGLGTGAAWAQGSYDSQYVVLGNDSTAEYLYLAQEKTGNGLAVAGAKVHTIGRWTQ